MPSPEPAARPRLILVSGVSGSGKTTYARTLEQDGFARLTLDERVWAADPSGHPTPETTASCEADLRAEATTLLSAGQDVCVDLPLCKRSQRDAYRALAADAGATAELVWVQARPATLHARIAARAGHEGPNAFPIAPEQLDRFIAGFDQPAPDEDARLIVTD